MTSRIFWISLVIIIFSWTANTIFAYSKQLNAPIFLDHYFNTVIQEDNVLSLYYLTNKDDFAVITHVNLGDMTAYVSNTEFNEDFGFGFEDDIDQNIDVFTHHALRVLHIELNQFAMEEALKSDPFTFTEIDIGYSDGRYLTLPIGKIILNADFPVDNALSSIRSSGSSDGRSDYFYQADEALSIDNISVDFEEVLRDYLTIKINKTNKKSINFYDIAYPLSLEKDEKIHIQTQISADFTGVLNTFITISGTTEPNNNFTSSVPLFSQIPELKEKDVNKIIKEKSGGDVR